MNTVRFFFVTPFISLQQAHLKLAENVDKNSSVEHRLAVNGRDEVGDLLEGERLQLLHDLGDALHLLALEREQ